MMQSFSEIHDGVSLHRLLSGAQTVSSAHAAQASQSFRSSQPGRKLDAEEVGPEPYVEALMMEFVAARAVFDVFPATSVPPAPPRPST